MKKTTKYFTIFALLIMVLSLGIGVAKWNIHYQKPIDTSINTGPTHGEGDGKIDLIDYYINVADGAKVADPYQYQMASGGGIANGSVEYSYQYDPNYTQGPSLSMDGAQYNLQGSTKPSTVNDLTETMFEESYRLNRVPFSAAKKTGGRHMIDKGFNSELVVEYDDENNVMTVTVNYTVAGRSNVYSNQLTLNYDGTTPSTTNETVIEGVGYSYFNANYDGESAYSLTFVFGKNKNFDLSKRSFGRFYTVPTNTNDCWTTEKPKDAGIYTYKVKVKDTEANPYLIDGGEKTVDFAILPKTNDGTTSCTYESPAQTQMLSYRLADSLGNAETATVDGETVYFVTYNGATFDIQIKASGTDIFEVGIHGNTSEVSNGQKEIVKSGDTLKFADDSAVTLDHCNVAQAWSENPNYILTNPYRYYLILPAKFENVSVPDFTKDFNPNTETLAGIPYTIDQNALQATCTSINGQTATWSFSKNNASFASSLTATNVADSGEYYYKIEADNHVPATGSFTVTINKFKVNVPGKDTTNFVYSASEQTYTPVAANGHDIYYTVSTNKRTDAGEQNVTVTLKNTDNYEWNASLPTYTFTIAPAPLSVTADDKSITYGDEAPAYTETYSGFVGGENESVLTGTLTLSCTYAKGNDAGTYPITPSGLSSTNYEITFVGGTLTVERKGLEKPTASVKTYIYDGSAQKFELSGFDSSTMGVSNDTRTNAGSQQVEISILNKTNYCWSDKSDSDFELTFTIEGKTISLSWSNTTLTYNGDPQKPTAEATGVISGDTVTVTVEGAQTAAGNYTATASINNGNYVLDNPTQSFTIEPKEITVVWNTGTYVYSGSPQGPTATATGLIGNDTLTLTVTGYGTNAGSHTAVVEAFTSGNYKLSSNSEKAYTIEKQPISGSFKFNKTEYVETHTGNPISVLTNGGVQIVNSDGSAIDTDLFKVEYSGDVSATEVGNYTLTATVSAASDNYSMTPVTINFAWSIKASVQSVEKVAEIKNDAPLTYEGRTFAAESYVDANDGYTVTFKLNGQVTTPRNAGDYTVVISLNDGYQWADGSTEDITLYFTIAKATLTVTPSADDITYGGTPIFSRAITGFVGDDAMNNVDIGNVSPIYETNYDKNTNGNVGEYTISITNNPYTAANYDFNYVEGSFRVTALTVAAPESKIANGTSVQYSGTTYTAESFYVSSTYYTVKINGSDLTEFSAVGTYTITVELNANYAWSGNAPGEISFTITAKPVAVPTLNLSNAPAGITVAWGQTASFPYDGKDHELIVTGSGEGYTVTYTNGQIGRTTGSYGVTVELVNGNYAWSDGNTSPLTYTYTIDKIVVTIPTPDTTAIPYDTNPHTFSVTASDYYTSTPVTGTNAGTYTVTADLKDKDNYIWSDDTTAQKSFTFTISKASLTITAKSYSINLGQAAPNYEVTYSEFAGTETSAVLGGNLVLTCDYNPTTSSVGEYAIVPSGLTSTNYEIKYVAGTLTVSKQSVVKPTSAGKTYTYNNANQTFILNNFDANTMTVSNNVQKNADTYTVTVSLKDTANYQWADGTTDPLTFSFVISAKPVNISDYEVVWEEATTTTGTPFNYYYTGSGIIPKAYIMLDGNKVYFDLTRSNVTTNATMWGYAGTYTATVDSDCTLLNSDSFNTANYQITGDVNSTRSYKISVITLRIGDDQSDVYYSNGISTAANKFTNNYSLPYAGSELPKDFKLEIKITTDDITYEDLPAIITVGNTYKIVYYTNNNNIVFEDGINYFYYKYKTAYLGTDTSTYYTIEEALGTNSTTTITLAGSATGASTYTSTSFTKLDYYGTSEYTIPANRTLLVPYTNSLSEKDSPYASPIPGGEYVYACLIIPNGITLNVSANANLTVGALIYNSTTVRAHGVIMNDGIINVYGTINAYGYVKSSAHNTETYHSTGHIYIHPNATGTELMKIHFWPGGNTASKAMNDVFIITKWSAHNISCTTTIYAGATYMGFTQGDANSNAYPTTACIIGANNDIENCLFKPTDTGGKIVKSARPASNGSYTTYSELTSIAGTNTRAGQRDIFEIYGNYTDATLNVKVAGIANVNTSTAKSAPIAYMDITVKSGASLLLSSSDYLVLPGTQIKIEENAAVKINSGVDMVLLDNATLTNIESTHTDANIKHAFTDTQTPVLYVGGTLTVDGSIGGRIVPTSDSAVLIINGNTSAAFTLLTGYYGTLQGFGKTYTYKGSGYAATGPTSSGNSINLETASFNAVASGDDFIWQTATALQSYTLTMIDGNTTTVQTRYFVGESTTVSAGALSKDYYTWGGWYTDENLSAALDDNPITAVNGDSHTIYAKWTENTYTIRYTYLTSTGGQFTQSVTNDSGATVKVSVSATIKDAVSTGFTFDGWYISNPISDEFELMTNANGELMRIKDGTIISTGTTYGGLVFGKDITELELVCYFKEMFTVTYIIPNYDSVNTSVIAGSYAQELDLNNYNNKDSDEYIYEGWYTDETYSQKYDFVNTAITSPLTLYAKAIAGQKTQIMLTIDPNGGTLINGDTTSTSAITVSKFVQSNVKGNFSLISYSATRDGYVFAGYWNTSSDGSGDNYTNTISLSSSATIYPVLIPLRTITISNTGTTTSINVVSCVCGQHSGTHTTDTVLCEGDTFKVTSFSAASGYYNASFTINDKVGAVNTIYTVTGDTTIKGTATAYLTVTLSGTNKNNIKYVVYRGSTKLSNNFKPGDKLIVYTDDTDGLKFTITGTTADASDVEIKSTGEANGKTYYFNTNVTISSSGSCIVEGTLITLADGSQKKIEDLTHNDRILVFNHETGKLDVSTMMFNAHTEQGAEKVTVTNMYFSNGTMLRIVSEHGFFDIDANKYVYITEENIESYLGHKFYSTNYVEGKFVSEIVTLDRYELTEETVRYYSPMSAYAINLFTEGILSSTAEYDELINVFELDENMMIDQAKKQADIDKYGLCDYETSIWKDYVSYEVFLAFNGQYVNVAIGKGLVTQEYVIYLIETYDIGNTVILPNETTTTQ